METRKQLSKIGLVFFIGTIIIFGLQIGIGMLLPSIAPELNEKAGFLFQMLPIYVVAVPVMALLMKKVPKQKVIEKSKLSVLQLFMYFLVGYAAMYITNLLGNGIATLIGQIKNAPVQNAIVNIAGSNALWLNFVVMVLFAPVFEELLFRKLVIDRTVQYGDKFAIILSAAMFALFHGNLYQFVYAFALGIVFGYLYTKTGTIVYSTILHMVINFFGSVLGVLVMRATGFDKVAEYATDQKAMMEYMMENPVGIGCFYLYAFALIGLVIAGIAVFAANKKKIVLNPAEIEIPKGQRFKTVVLNIGMGLYILFWLAMIVYMTII